MNDKKKFEQFVNSIKKEKLSGFVDGEKSEIAVDYKRGFRLDHQGLNNDPSTKPHRIYVQPIKGGSSIASRQGISSNVVASIHCDDPEDDQKIRDGLIESFKQKSKTVVV
ncbi:hypothetical protein G7Y79_00020g049000 [Physcia stellaris]|nr:hypothetical protein G7Y79_00020g049000 [Physcia stellaris]